MGKKGQKAPSRKQQRTENRRAVRADRAEDKNSRAQGESTFLQRRLTPLEQVRGGRVLLGDDNEDLVIRLIALLELGAEPGDALGNSCDLQDCFRLLGLDGTDDASEDNDDEYDEGGRSQLFRVQEGDAGDGDVGNEDFVPFAEDETGYGGGVGGRASHAAEIDTSDDIDLEALLRGEDQSRGGADDEGEEEGEEGEEELGGGRYGPVGSDSESSFDFFDSDNDTTTTTTTATTTTTIISPTSLSADKTSRAPRGLSVHQRKLLVRKIVRDARRRGRAGDNDYWHTPNAANAASAVSAVASMTSPSASRIITTPTTCPNEELSTHLKRLLTAHRANLDDDIDHTTAHSIAHTPAAALSRALLTDTASLPIAAHKEHLLATIASNPVTLICGDTGSGKSTQVPKYVLQRAIEEGRGAECFIIVTQPRRIAAISLARRVAAEMGGGVVAVGGEEDVEMGQEEEEGGQEEEGQEEGGGQEEEEGKDEDEEEEVGGSFFREEFDGVTSRDTDTWGGLVGYQVRLCSSYGRHTRLLFVTTGTLLRRLSDQSQGQGCNDLWSLLSHVFIDEVHERQLETDFLLAVLKERALAQAGAGAGAGAGAVLFSSLGLCPGPRLVLMSATMDEALLGNYFEEAFRSPSIGGGAAVCRVGGRCFPVKTHFIEEIEHVCVVSGGRERAKGQGVGIGVEASRGHVRRPFFCADLLADLVMRIIDGSALKGGQGQGPGQGEGQGQCILVFMSGVDSIDKVRLALRRQGVGAGSAGVEVLTLHGRMSSAQQSLVFRPFETATYSHTQTQSNLQRHGQSQSQSQSQSPSQPPAPRWRVVLATNVAETSLTVPGVVHVIDTGLCKEVSYDAVSNLRSLKQFPCSQSSIKQRAGRAGRVCEGHYWAFFGESWSGGALAKLEDVVGMRPPTTPASDQDPARTPSLTQVESTAPLCSLPEVMRVPLDSLLLQVLALSPTMVGQEGPVAFMQGLVSPPSTLQVCASLARLVRMGAVRAAPPSDSPPPVTDSKPNNNTKSSSPYTEGTSFTKTALYSTAQLTPLGHHLSRLPMDPPLAKALLMAVLLGCEEPVLSAVAALSAGSGGGGGGIWWMAANASASSAGCVGGGGSDARARARAIHASFMHGWPVYGNGVGDGGTSAGAGTGAGAGEGAGAGAEIAISDHLAAALAFALWDRVRRGVPLPGPWAAAAAAASSATANANSNTDANAANASDQHAFCQQHCLNHSGLRDMARLRSRFRSVLASAGLVSSNSSREGGSSSPDLPPASLVLYSLAYGFSPHVARVARGVWKGVNSGKKGPGGSRGGLVGGNFV